MKTKNSPNAVSGNSRAVIQLSSWLEACGIPHTVNRGQQTDITILSQEDEQFQVVVVTENPPTTVDALVVQSSQVTSRSRTEAFQAFHSITQAAGYGAPIPFDRGEEPTGKAHYSDEFELVAMRHRQFRRAPNPSPEKLAQYKPVIERVCWQFLRGNPGVCGKNCLEKEDLRTYAQLWTTNYIAHFEIPNATDDNMRKLSAYLWQCFNEFRALLFKKGASIFPDKETAELVSYKLDEQGEVDEEYVARHNQLDKTTTARRRASAKNLLSKLLSEMPHDEMVAVLQEKVDNFRFNPEVAQEARRQLRLHSQNCHTCSSIPALEESEVEAGSDEGSLSE